MPDATLEGIQKAILANEEQIRALTAKMDGTANKAETEKLIKELRDENKVLRDELSGLKPKPSETPGTTTTETEGEDSSLGFFDL